MDAIMFTSGEFVLLYAAIAVLTGMIIGIVVSWLSGRG